MASVALRMTSTGTLTLFALSSTLNLFNIMKLFFHPQLQVSDDGLPVFQVIEKLATSTTVE